MGAGGDVGGAIISSLSRCFDFDPFEIHYNYCSDTYSNGINVVKSHISLSPDQLRGKTPAAKNFAR